jgi:hypothetical protein
MGRKPHSHSEKSRTKSDTTTYISPHTHIVNVPENDISHFPLAVQEALIMCRESNTHLIIIGNPANPNNDKDEVWFSVQERGHLRKRNHPLQMGLYTNCTFLKVKNQNMNFVPGDIVHTIASFPITSDGTKMGIVVWRTKEDWERSNNGAYGPIEEYHLDIN